MPYVSRITHMKAAKAKYDAIVIGSGIGGLAAATRLAQRAHRVLLLEASSDFGGYIRPVVSGEYVFDLGLHYLGKLGPGEPFRELLDQLGLHDLEFVELDPDALDRYVFPDYQFDFCKGRERLTERLIRDFPSEERGIRRFVDNAVRINRASAPSELATGGPWTWMKYLARHPMMLRYGRLTYQSFLDRTVKDRRLQAVLSAPLFDVAVGPREVSAATAMSLWGYFLDGAYYPRGGSKGIRDAFIDGLRKRDVELVHSAPVVAINRQAGMWAVRTESGEQYTSRVVISDVNPAVTVCSLWDPTLVPRGVYRKAARLRPSGSILTVFVGTELDLVELGFTTGNVCQYTEWDVESYYDGWHGRASPSANKALFMNSPSVRDAQGSYAPQGEHTLQLLAGWSYESVEQWASLSPQDRGEEYEELKRRLCEALLAAAEAQVPGLAAHVTHIECITPLECADRVRAVRGGIYGPALIPSQMGPGRFQSLTCGVDGLFLAGAGTFGCGLYYCAASGLLAAEKSLAFLGH
jgi:all-trans-retinol 13,14-reductase